MAHNTAMTPGCVGHQCLPIRALAEAAPPATITPAPTAQYTPAPGCLDPENLWIVTTSCYITSPTYIGPDSTPGWLTCSVTNFGAPDWRDPSCYLPYPQKTTSGAESWFYDGCPSGYTAVATSTGPGYDTFQYSIGYYDAIYYSTACCPT